MRLDYYYPEYKGMQLEWAEIRSLLLTCPKICFYGPPGMGKSWAAMHLPNALAVTYHEDSSPSEQIGHYVPTDTGAEFILGHGSRAMLEGFPLVMNEINKASGECLTMAYCLADDFELARITLPNKEGTVIRPKAGYKVIATMNGNPEDELPPPLLDRFQVRIKITEPPPEAMEMLPSQHRGVCFRAIVQEQVSFRAFHAYFSLSRVVGDELAIRAVFGAKATSVKSILAMGPRTEEEEEEEEEEDDE
jgi:MoxR-like ATPase